MWNWIKVLCNKPFVLYSLHRWIFTCALQVFVFFPLTVKIFSLSHFSHHSCFLWYALGLKNNPCPCTVNTLHICILSLQVSLKLKCAWWWTACSRSPNLLIELNSNCSADMFSSLYCKPNRTNKRCDNGNALLRDLQIKASCLKSKMDINLERKSIKTSPVA